MSEKENLNLAQWALEQALKTGASEAAASISKNRNIKVECRDKKIETLQESIESSLRLDIYAANRYSSNSTNDLQKARLKDFIKQSIAMTKFLAEDKYRSLPDPKYYLKDTSTDLKIYDSSFDQITPAERKNRAMEIESAAMTQSEKIISATAVCSDNSYQTVRIHSNGFFGKIKGTSFFTMAAVTVSDKDKRPEEYYFTNTRFLKDLPSNDVIGKTSAQLALQKIGQGKIDSGKYELIVENRVAERLLGTILEAMNGSRLQQKQSYLDSMLGKKIASEKLTMIENPFIEKGLGSRLYDNEGLSAKKMVMIEKGVLQNYYIDNYYSRKLGMEPTSGSSSNLTFECGSKSLSDMIKNMKKGIVITGFIGGNSNSTTGDFSFGIFGQFVQNGQIVRPVSEMNVSGNAKEFWNQLVEAGNDPYIYSSSHVPSLFFENVSFSGV